MISIPLPVVVPIISANAFSIIHPNMHMRSPVPVVNCPLRLRRLRRRLNIPPGGLDIPKSLVPRLRGCRNRHRHGDEAVPLNVDFFFARVRVAPAAGAATATARFDGGFDIHGDDFDLGFWFWERRRTWRRRRRARRWLSYHGGGLYDGRGTRTRRRGGRRGDDSRDLAARGEEVGFWAGEVQAFFRAVACWDFWIKWVKKRRRVCCGVVYPWV